MLRAVSSIYIESQALELFVKGRRDVFKLFRTSSTTPSSHQTVLASENRQSQRSSLESDGAACGRPSPPPPPLPPPPPQPPRRAWTVAAAALALTASIGGVYFYKKLAEEDQIPPTSTEDAAPAAEERRVQSDPATGAELPAHVQYLLAGGGTASFAAMRAIRSARADAQVLIVSAEPALPYMRPPLSKELWREPDLAASSDHLESVTFRQWNGRRRVLAYEPGAFYAPVEQLARGEGGAALARGWRVVRLDVRRHEAELESAGGERATVRYDKCLVATGVRARRAEALRGARQAEGGAARVLALRDASDAARLARALDQPGVRGVAVVGGGFLASELSAALADRLRGSGKSVTQVFREATPMAGVLPRYLGAEAARCLQRIGVKLLPLTEVTDSSCTAEGVQLSLAGGEVLEASLVVECVGGEVDASLAAASGLETHPALGGLLVNAELQARADVWAAGDVACFYDEALGRRRLEHHDHAVVSGRLAGANMAASPPQPYVHQSMFWSDLGPDLGYEAIGIIDSKLPTVGVFSESAVSETSVAAEAAAAAGEAGEARAAGGPHSLELGAADEAAAAGAGAGAAAAGAEGARAAGSPRVQMQLSAEAAAARRYERGVVFYTRDSRVVGVLLWNLFNRMHVARQVLKQGEFEDLFEVAKLFSLHEDE